MGTARRTRRTWIGRAALVALVLLAGAAGAPASGTTQDRPELASLRVRLTTSSDWASIDLEHLVIRARHVHEQAGLERIWTRPSGWSAIPAEGPGELVVDLVVELEPDRAPRVVLSKGRVGTATVEITRTGDGAGASGSDALVELVLDTHDPHQNQLVEVLDPAAVLGPGLPLSEVDGRRLTLAFYYPWFDLDAVHDRRISPERPGSWYATSDAAHVAGMVAEAVSAGVDGFLVSWEGSMHGEVVDLLAREVARHPGFVVAPTLELKGTVRRSLLGDRFDPTLAARATRDFLGRVEPTSLLEVGGRPVLVAFGMWDLQAHEWQDFRTQIADLDPFVIGDRLDPAFPVDGHYQYDPNPLSIDALDRRYQRALDRTTLEPLLDPAREPLLWAATASPGYDNRGSRLLLGRQVTSRAEGWRYDEAWRVALRSLPDWVFVTSWNEWYEQTHISPGGATGAVALDQTARWSERFSSAAG